MINNNGNSYLLISVFDLNGKQLAAQKVDANGLLRIDASAFPGGIYNLEVYNPVMKSFSFQKLMK